MPGDLCEPAHARPVRYGFGQLPGVGSTVPVDDQLGEEDEVGLLGSRPLAPAGDGVQHALGLA